MKKCLLLFLTLTGAASLHAQDKPDLQTSAYRDSIAQEEVRTQAEAVRQKLLQLLDDIQQNQMQIGDFSEAQKAATGLATLNASQVVPLIEMLKQAGNQQQASDLEAKLAAASQSQKNIQLNLKTLADSLEFDKDQSALQQRFEQLVLRQTTNLRQTTSLAGAGAQGGTTPSQLLPIIDIAQSEQANLAKEIELAVDTLQKVVDTLPQAQQAGFSDALAEAQRLNIGPLASTAADQTAARTFTVAASTQKQVLDGLQDMLIKLKTNQSLQERLQDMSEKLEQAADAQKALAEKTAQSDNAAKNDLRESQSQISDQVSTTQKELAELNANVFKQTAQAMTSMQTANTALSTKALDQPTKQSVAQTQHDAAAQLQSASDALQKQSDALAQADSAQSPVEKMDALSDLDKKVQDAMAKAAQTANPSTANAAQPPPSAQDQAQTAANMQQEAQPISPAAASDLGDASAQMQQNSPADAQSSLAKADSDLQAQMAGLKSAADLEKKLQDLSDQVAAVQKQTSQAGDSLKDKSQTDPTAAVKQTQTAQGMLSQAQTQAGATTPPDVKKDLDAAQGALAQSANSAVQSKKDDASAANGGAQKDLQSAMAGLGAALAQAKAAGGSPQPGGQGQSPMMGGPEMGMGKGMGNVPGQAGMGFEGRDQSLNGGFMASSGPKGGPGQVVGQLNPKDRDAISLLQKEKAPPEYQTMVQQYLKNLAEGSTPATSSTQ